MNSLRLLGLLVAAASLHYLLSSVGQRKISSLAFEDVESRISLSISKNVSVATAGGVRRPWGSSVIDKTNQDTQAEDPRIYLIHVGKCGGVTVLETLGRGARGKELECRMEKRSTGAADDDCRRIMPGRNSTLSRRIIGRYHVGSPLFSRKEKEWLLNDTDTFLYLIRDPLDRVRSAFEYHKNMVRMNRDDHKKFYVNCFPGRFDEVVEAMRGAGSDEKCKDYADRALGGGGLVVAGNHFYYNYQWYRRFSLGGHPSHTVMVIRTEHLWDDMIRLDKRLGGDGNFARQGAKETHGSETWSHAPNSTSIAPENAAYLCCLMYGEFEVYQELILRAVNLHDEEKREDLVKVMRHCQMDVSDGDIDLLATPFSWQEFGEGPHCAHVPAATESNADLPPLPRTRFLAWSLLSADQMQMASDMGYAEDTWNLLGSSDVEHLTFNALDNPQRKAARSLGMTTEDIWDCHINHYRGYLWSNLVESGLDQYYSALGWTKADWEEGSRRPASESKYWEGLSFDERSAATQLCYTEEIWDEVPISILIKSALL